MNDNGITVGDVETLQTRWDALRHLAYVLLERLAGMFQVQFVDAGNYYAQENAIEFRHNLPASLSAEMKQMQVDLAEFSARAITAAKSSVLASAADQAELRINSRRMIAAFDFQDYRFFEAEVMSYEDQYLGTRPASQTVDQILPGDALRVFTDAAAKVTDLLLFIANSSSSGVAPTQSVPPISGAQHKPDTAFILMMMSDEHPELEDVKVGIVEVFREFGILALRADDIEHEGSITDRIKQQITSAEFLIADLTGARPNVYYEVGYAHALRKRTILYRKKDTVLHFDLAGLNVPSYNNVADLKKKLRTRLEAILGTVSPVSRRV